MTSRGVADPQPPDTPGAEPEVQAALRELIGRTFENPDLHERAGGAAEPKPDAHRLAESSWLVDSQAAHE